MKPSGKFVLRLDPELHQELKSQALAHKMSLNEWIKHRLQGTQALSPIPIIDRLLKTFSGNLVGVVQFGSSVRNEMHKSSDVDLLLVLKTEFKFDRSIYQKWDREFNGKQDAVLSPQFSHLPVSVEYSSLWLEIALEGVIHYDPTGQVFATIRKIRDAIAEGRFHRKLSHGHPYWVRKEIPHAE